MGEAKRRGTKEQRLEAAIKKKELELPRKKKLSNKKMSKLSALLAAGTIAAMASSDRIRHTFR